LAFGTDCERHELYVTNPARNTEETENSVFQIEPMRYLHGWNRDELFDAFWKNFQGDPCGPAH